MPLLTLDVFNRTLSACIGSADDAVDESRLDEDLRDLGLDSIAVYELAARLQDDLGVPIPDERLDELTTPRMIIDFVNAADSEGVSVP